MIQHQSLFLLLVLAVVTANAFVVVPVVVPQQQQQLLQNVRSTSSTTSTTLHGIFSDFFDELVAFVDDATSRRLGAGAAFYGKRKSKFYGEKDTGRKSDPTVADPTGKYRYEYPSLA
jgi:hypothetical protein